MPELSAPTGEVPPPSGDAAAEAEAETDYDPPSSVVTMVRTNSGLWRICVYAQHEYTGENWSMFFDSAKFSFSNACDAGYCDP